MVIYGNNLHEKLQGLALSRDYLKYNTPFCDLVDDPDWEIDINLALDYQSAISGNLDAADRFVQSLTINSSILDGSTIEYYITKMSTNPAFRSAIDKMKSRWGNPGLWSDDFQFNFEQALKDCLNSPCNLFLETSDSIGRIAQAASTKTSNNTFGVASLSASFTNMIDGLDQTLLNKIPSVFANAWTEVTQVADKAFTNTQKVLAGEANLSVFANLITAGDTLRSPEKVFRYTPDVKSYYDYSAASSNVLSKIKEEMGGCFNRFEYNYRYNPYEDNLSRPIGEKTQQVNNRTYDSDSTGTVNRIPDNDLKLEKSTTVDPESITTVTTDSSRGPTSISENIVHVSDTYELTPQGPDKYTVFAGLVDTDRFILWYDSYNKKYDDVLTTQGLGNIGENYRIGISVLGNDTQFIKKALNGEEVSVNDIKKYGDTTQPGSFAAGYKHNLTDEGMETLYNTPQTKIVNDGVAISLGLFRKFLNDPKATLTDASIINPEKANELFVAARPAGERLWKLYKVIDSNSQLNLNLDFTMGAYKHFLKSFNRGDLKDYITDDKGKKISKREPIEGTDWNRVNKNFLSNDVGTMEIRICVGAIDQVKDVLGIVDEGAGDTLLPAIEDGGDAVESREATDIVANDDYSDLPADKQELYKQLDPEVAAEFAARERARLKRMEETRADTIETIREELGDAAAERAAAQLQALREARGES